MFRDVCYLRHMCSTLVDITHNSNIDTKPLASLTTIYNICEGNLVRAGGSTAKKHLRDNVTKQLTTAAALQRCEKHTYFQFKLLIA